MLNDVADVSPVSVQAVFYGFKDIEITIAGNELITKSKFIVEPFFYFNGSVTRIEQNFIHNILSCKEP
ncbi:MAG: hypothetical protein J0M11_01355 [Anaerolineae bacterium]|nr:hypothetical protein [Anaerolineae bacterium]